MSKNSHNLGPCHCFIKHARTPSERSGVTKMLAYSRSVGDSLGIMLCLASLGPCKVDPVSDAANEPGFATK